MTEPSDFFNKRLGELWARYKAAGGTQVTLGTAAGVTQGQISIWLRGVAIPSIGGIVALSRAFEVSVSEFFPPEVRGTQQPSDPALRPILDAWAQLDDVGRSALLIAADDLVRDQARNKKTPNHGSGSQGAS